MWEVVTQRIKNCQATLGKQPLAQVKTPSACWKCLHHARPLCRHLDGGGERAKCFQNLSFQRSRISGHSFKSVGSLGHVLLWWWRSQSFRSGQHNTCLTYGLRLVTVYSCQTVQKPKLKEAEMCKMKTHGGFRKSGCYQMKTPFKN